MPKFFCNPDPVEAINFFLLFHLFVLRLFEVYSGPLHEATKIRKFFVPESIRSYDLRVRDDWVRIITCCDHSTIIMGKIVRATPNPAVYNKPCLHYLTVPILSRIAGDASSLLSIINNASLLYNGNDVGLGLEFRGLGIDNERTAMYTVYTI